MILNVNLNVLRCLKPDRARHLVVRQHVQQADGALGHGVVLVVESGQDARQVAQRRDLVGQLALAAEQTHGGRGDRLQSFALQGDQRCEAAEPK